ncbi:MAG: hypothetical protein ACYDC3_10305 [Candidatus Binataceae bacterium]
MKRTIVPLLAIAFVLMAIPAAAGVMITQLRQISGPAKDRTFGETAWMQGHKRKTVLYQGAIIIDLDAGKLYQLDLVHKRYSEKPFPPTGPMGKFFARSEGMFALKKTGISHLIAGASCDDYAGSIDAPGVRYTTTECISTSAPGAAEFSEFRSAMADKLKSAGLAPASISVPPGIPLAVDFTTQMLASPMPKGKNPPNEGVEIQQKLAEKHPMVSRTEISKIEVTNFPADTFAVPPGFRLNSSSASPLQKKTGAAAAQPAKP